MKALILSDIQNDFLANGATPIPHAEDAVALANRLMPNFDVVVATQLWHPGNHVSFANQYAEHGIGDEVEVDGQTHSLQFEHCIQNTHGAALADGLAAEKINTIFHKGSTPDDDAFSDFADAQGKNPTGLDEYLSQHDVTDVFVMGLDSESSVKNTAIEAQKRGFHAHVVAEGVFGTRPSTVDRQKMLDEIRSENVEIVHAADITK